MNAVVITQKSSLRAAASLRTADTSAVGISPPSLTLINTRKLTRARCCAHNHFNTINAAVKAGRVTGAMIVNFPCPPYELDGQRIVVNRRVSFIRNTVHEFHGLFCLSLNRA